jgi:uncharacterized membrane protein YhaH (DUF805 family)
MELFSFRGRVDRSTNLFIQFTLNVVGWGLGTISANLVNDQQFVAIFLGLLMVGGLWIGLASYVKRAHDAGRSALFALGPYPAAMIALPLGLEIEKQSQVFGAVMIVAALIYFLGVLLWVTFKAGDPETNRYGEAPPLPPSAQRVNAPVEQPTIDD